MPDDLPTLHRMGLMRLNTILPVAAIIAGGIVAALLAAVLAASLIENRARADVARNFSLNGYDWVTVDVDGLLVILNGTAADEAVRFRALNIAGGVVNAARIVDRMDVAQSDAGTPPRFSIEILRNADGISLIGLAPAAMDRETVVSAIRDIAGGVEVTDLLSVASYPPPDGWGVALSYGLSALASLPSSKISITADGVTLTAISQNAEEKSKLEADLARRTPTGLAVSINISAPRPVISPYVLSFELDASGGRLTACSTETPAGRDMIIGAARAAGMNSRAECDIGLGVPGPAWDDAAAAAIKSVAKLGGGSVSISDADIKLVAPQTTPPATFERVVTQLKKQLPAVFSLAAVLPEPVVIDAAGVALGPPEFIATRSPEGDVSIRGRILDERARVATESFARGRFTNSTVSVSMRLDDSLPRGWSIRVLASLDALALLNNGSVVTLPDSVEIRGVTGDSTAEAAIRQILLEKLGPSDNYRISVTYREKLDPQANIPTPAECVAQINQVLDARKISFAPGSATIDEDARETIAGIALVMKECVGVEMEVAGHTDSQGREVMNQALSQARAEAVVNALLARRILTSGLIARGYGETRPIADNSTEAGREANRRIEFSLVTPESENAVARADAATAQTAAPAVADDPTDPHPEETESPDEQN
ncbi:MAG: OmpA family protein [Paracoccaceae bacterium]